MSFAGSHWPFTEQTIKSVAPRSSGVYGLYNPQVWVYIGETMDIEDRLLQHRRGDNPCITSWSPTRFVFETVEAGKRVARQDELILELNPVCNRKLG